MYEYQVDILERMRLIKGLSYSELANTLGINKVTVSRTLNGLTTNPHTVKRLADCLGVEMSTIVKRNA